jgi:hypothetical protein
VSDEKEKDDMKTTTEKRSTLISELGKSEQRAKGLRLPNGDVKLHAKAGAGKYELNGRFKSVLDKVVKAGADGISLKSVATDRYSRWAVRCLIKNEAISFTAPKEKEKPEPKKKGKS